MASTIDKAFVQQFRSNVIHLAQQKMSRLRAHVITETVKAEKHNFERLGATDAVEKTTRHTVTPVLDTPHSRRVLTLKDYHWADLVDEEDKIRMLISPESEYARAGAMAMGREYDDLIIAAASADATDGDGNAVALPASHTIVHGSAAMTIDKMLEAKEILDSEENDPDDPRVLVLGSRQLRDLLNTTEVTSQDFAAVKALVRGEVDSFLGFSIVRSERLALATTTRTCLAFTRSSIGLGIGRDVVTRIDPRPDVSYATQVYLAFTANATRIHEEGVVEIECTEA
jgi:hypothetical protein